MTNTTPTPASNSEVLKRFGRRMIMWRAHGIYKLRQWGVATFSEALKAAWHSYRAQINRERESAHRRAKRSQRFAKYITKDSLLNRPYASGDSLTGRGSDRWLTTVIGA